MSYEAMHKVRASGLTDRTQVDVLEALAFFLNQETGACFPSTEAIARISRVNDRLVRTTLKTLHNLGLLSSTQKVGQKRYFTLHLERLPAPEPLSELTGGQEDTGGDESTPLYESTPLHKSTVEGCRKVQGTPVEKCSTPLYKTTAEQGINKELNKVVNKEGGAPAEGDLFNDDVKEIKTPKKVASQLVNPEGVSDEVWTDWQALKRKLCKSCTQRMVNAIVREAAKAGMTVEEAMIYQLEKGWKGFEADWITDKRPNKRSTNIRFEGHDNDFSCIYG